MSIKQINDTTFSADGLGDVKPSVLIGGKDESKFIPNINISFHSDEFFINLNRKNKNAIAAKDKTDSKAEIPGDDTDIFHIDDSGRLKWDIQFDKAPSSMVLSWELKCSNDIEFLYQYELSEQEIKDGLERPDEIISSYAVYCNKSHNAYKTGKLCHILRPFVIDANGAREWCALKIEKNELSITLPEKFMQSAAYPVTLDPYIGFNSIGGTAFGTGQNYMYLQRYNITMPEAGTASKLYIYARSDGSTRAAYLGYYSESAGVPGSAVERNLPISITSATPAWYYANLTANSLANGANYYPGFLINVAYNLIYMYVDSAANNIYFATAQSTMPATAPTMTSANYRASIYLEYTVSASGNPYYYYINQ